MRNCDIHIGIKRDIYLDRLIKSKHNGMIKVVTGIRRCGKSSSSRKDASDGEYGI